MADNGIIKHSDLFADDIGKKTISELLAVMDVIEKTEASIKQFAATYKGAFAGGVNTSFSGINKLAEETEKANRLYIENVALTKAKKEIEDSLNKSLNEQSKTIDELIKKVESLTEKKENSRKKTAEERLELERKNKAEKDEAKLSSSKTGAYERATVKLAQMTRTYKNLVIAGKENNTTSIEFKKRLDELRASVVRADQAVGDHRRNVGNYESGFSGLQNSINQVTREFPAFVNSFQTGFMAISNNLPMLSDQIQEILEKNKELKAEGKEGESVFGQLTGALFSWGTALSLGVTLLTVYGKEIGEFLMQVFKIEDAFKKLEYQQKTLLEVQKEASTSVLDEKLKLEQLIAVVNSDTKSKEDKLKAIKEINLISPEYLNNITLENIGTETGKKLIDDYILSLEKKAKAQAFNNKLTALNQKLIDEENKSFAEYRTVASKFDEVISPYFGKISSKARENREKALDVINREIKATKELMFAEIEKGNVEVETAKADEEAKKLREKHQKDTKKTAEEAAKLDQELQEKLSKSKIDIIEDETNRKIKMILYLVEVEKAANLERYKDKKKVAELNKNLDMIAVREIEDLLKIEDEIKVDQIAKEEKRLTKESEEILKKEKLRLNNILRARKNEADEKAKLEKEEAKKESERLKSAAKVLDEALAQRTSMLSKQTDREIAISQRRQTELRELAARGVDDAKNSLAFEERREAELLVKKQKLEQRKRREELATAVIKSYAANVEKNQGNALGSTLKDISTLSAVVRSLPAFYEGTEDTGKGGNLDDKGGFAAILHPNERVLTAEQNKMIGGMTNEELSKLAFNVNQFDKMPVVNHYNDDKLINEVKELKTEIQELTKIIDNKPTSQFDYDKVNNAIINREILGSKTSEKITKNKGGFFA